MKSKDYFVVGIMVAIIFSVCVAFKILMPDYEKYKAGEYREHVECQGSKPYCWWVKLGNYKEKEVN